MGYVSVLGRIIFASVFILSAWQQYSEYKYDGGVSKRVLGAKFNHLAGHLLLHTGMQLPKIDVRLVAAIAIFLKSMGGILFVVGSNLGAFLLLLHQAIMTPIMYDFYNYEADTKQFHQLFANFTQSLALLGALLFFIGMKNSGSRRVVPKQTKKVAPKHKST